MKKSILVLSGLLVAQLVLALTVNLNSDKYGTFKADEKLLSAEINDIDKLQISDDETSIILAKQDGKWVLPNAEDCLADNAKVEQLMTKLSGLEKGWPTATTSEALKRFKVSDEVFERKLSFLKGDKEIAQLYVGTSPGFRKVHARPSNEDRVFTIPFNSWEVGAKIEDWIDREILKLDKAEIERIEISDLTLENQDGKLALTDMQDNEELNQKETDALVDELSKLQIISPLDKMKKSEYHLDEPSLIVKVKTKTNNNLDYRFSKLNDTSYYAVQRSDQKHIYKVAESSVKELLGINRNKLVQTVHKESENNSKTL